MEVNALNIRKSLNKAFLKVKPNRKQIETFKKNIINLFDRIDESESEEFHKNIISEFLMNTYYTPGHYINTKGRADLVIHTGKEASTPVGVLFETKKPGNSSEMPTPGNLKSKAFYELILYYMRERIKEKNISVKYLVITNIYEWFIFSSAEFERLFTGSKKLTEQFTDFEGRRLSGLTTDFFYRNVAETFVDGLDGQISFSHFDIRDYKSIIKNQDPKDDHKLIALYKIFSPEHLLKLPFANDSNSLDKTFYSELLHIIGLEESKEGSRKVIGRKKEEKRNRGSLIENAITILKSEDCLSLLPKKTDYGTTPDEKLFNVALELSITWINRILFLKLLEGQLVKYNGGNKTFRFLNSENISDFDELNKLFFRVLAVKDQERSIEIKKKFPDIPYLNSSLFEPSELEYKTIRINSLEDNTKLPLTGNTVLKDRTGKKLTGEIEPLEYLFAFLDAYDFSGEGSEDIQEENKTLINASVLGLIFEKINGYRDGSFFTPGFITMYMCHETITRAVVQKFNDAKGWNCETINNVYNRITDIGEANRIINSLRICDPAVGSGHFLVSALNEIIALKSELGVLADKDGKRLKVYHIEVLNDELVITDSEGNLFEYNPADKESQRVQETLFMEKQIIIENCLFGVDINPNSVKICRLRLWIELLKNAYYKAIKLDTVTPQNAHRKPHAVLETLPNIDINIKCGNSLISRYPLDADIRSALKSSRWTVDNYREAVMTYRNAQSKDEKRNMEQLIEKIKGEFETEVSKNDKRFLKLNKLKGDLIAMTDQGSLFELTKARKDEWNKKVKKLTTEMQYLESQIEEIKNNRIYENAFEWRFEFPEVLNNNGDFVGFDVVIGNPPYIPLENYKEKERSFFNYKFEVLERKYDSSVMFLIEGLNKLNSSGQLSFITPLTWQTGENYTLFRKWVYDQKGIIEIINLPFNIFEDAYVETGIYFMINRKSKKYRIYCFDKKDKMIDLNRIGFEVIPTELIIPNKYKIILNPVVNTILKRLKFNDFIKLGDITVSTQGLSGSLFKPTKSVEEDSFPFLLKGNVYNYLLTIEETYTTSLKNLDSLKQFYEAKPKILIRRIVNRQNRLSVAFTEEKMVFKKDINPFIPINEDYPAKYLLGIMASKLISYLYINLSSIATKDDFRQTTLTELRELLVPKSNKLKQSLIIHYVDEIINMVKNKPNTDTQLIESEIDRLVYELYGLTVEEIRIVEGQ